jgi:colicin import membrane protein
MDAARDTSRRPTRRKTADPFRYGWRDVHRTGPDGKREWVQLPLTREDVLHPEFGDVIVENDAHALDCTYLLEVCRARLADDPTALVLSDCKVQWDIPALRHHSPDLAVIFGVQPRPVWYSFNVKTEGVRPALLVEVTSPNTRSIDLRKKRIQYYQAGVPFYAILDQLPGPKGGVRRLRLLAYRRGQRGFERLPEDANGRVWLEPVRMWLGHENGRAALYDEAGERIGDYTEVVREKETAERRIRELEAELRKLQSGR